MYLVCYLGSANTIVLERAFNRYSTALEFIKKRRENVSGGNLRFILRTMDED